MDELEIKGKKYISSKRAAEITGYAKDYVGQLARSNKIPATRVGRSWYVSLLDIKQHAGISDESQTAQEATQDTQEEITNLVSTPTPTVETKAISKMLKPSGEEVTTYSVHRLQSQVAKKDVLKTWGQIKYEHDNRDLLPIISQKKELEKIHSVPLNKLNDITNKNIVISGKQTTNFQQKKPVQYTAPSKTKISTPPSTITANTQIAVIGGSVAFAGLLVALVSAHIPSETTFSFESRQVALATNDLLIPLQEYFSVVFNDGLVLLAGFLTTLELSFETFITIGIDFFLSLF